MKIYEKKAPSFLEKLSEDFPWYLRYYKFIIASIVIVFLGLGFLFGYLLEPEEDKILYHY